MTNRDKRREKEERNRNKRQGKREQINIPPSHLLQEGDRSRDSGKELSEKDEAQQDALEMRHRETRHCVS